GVYDLNLKGPVPSRNLGSLRSTRSAIPACIITAWAPASIGTIAAEGFFRARTRVPSSRQVAPANTSAIRVTKRGEVRCGSARLARLYWASAQVKADPS